MNKPQSLKEKERTLLLKLERLVRDLARDEDSGVIEAPTGSGATIAVSASQDRSLFKILTDLDRLRKKRSRRC